MREAEEQVRKDKVQGEGSWPVTAHHIHLNSIFVLAVFLYLALILSGKWQWFSDLNGVQTTRGQIVTLTYLPHVEAITEPRSWKSHGLAKLSAHL